MRTFAKSIYVKRIFSKVTIFFVTWFLLNAVSGCDKQEEYVPYVYVNFYLTLAGDLANVGVGGHYIVPDKGLNGIIIIRKDIYEYQAFELTCTYKAFEQRCKLNVDSDGWIASCPCCGSEFGLFLDGFPQKSPASKPLKQYRTTLSGNYLLVSN